MFAEDRNTKPARHWRIINEIPAVLMVGIVILASSSRFSHLEFEARGKIALMFQRRNAPEIRTRPAYSYPPHEAGVAGSPSY